MEAELERQSFCYVTTRGRVTGAAHEIEIWFAARNDTIFLLSGGGARADWVKNMLAAPAVTVRIGDEEFRGTARLVDDPEEETWARSALLEKYSPGYAGDLTRWSQTSLPVAIDVTT